MSRYAVLIGQINRDLTDLEQIITETRKLIAKVRATGETSAPQCSRIQH